MSVYIPVSLLILASSFFAPLGIANSVLPAVACRQQEIQAGRLMDSLRKKIGPSTQVILVGNKNPATIKVCISSLERKSNRWQRVFPPMNGVIGRKGFASPGEKREGDGRTPSGVFPLGMVFGYEPSFPTRMPYRQATADDLWIDDTHAEDYNRWARRGSTQATSYERMRRDDDLYKYGIIVEYNTNPVIKGQGSAIFFHLWKGKGLATAGCIALAEADLIRILKWLDPAATPLVVMGTKSSIKGF